MEYRPRSAPPRPHPRPARRLSPSTTTEELERRSKSSIGSHSQATSDSTESISTSLFHRVRALISPGGRDLPPNPEIGQLYENVQTKLNASATLSSYEVDGKIGHIRTPDFGGRVLLAPGFTDGGDEGPAVTPNSNDYQSDPDFDSVIRIGSVAQKTVAGSIVEESSPILARPNFSHASIPANIGRMGMPKNSRHRSLGKMTPSPVASAVGAVGTLTEDDSSEDEEVEKSKTIRRRVVSRSIAGSVSGSCKRANPIFRVYDDSSSGRSCTNSPDLFFKPLQVGSPVQKPPDTPTNTIATPPPLIGIVHASDSETSPHSPTSEQFFRDSGVRTPPEQSVLAHTGASTPEDVEPGTATVERGTMTEFDPEFDYDEYAEEEYGPPGVSKLPTKAGTPAVDEDTEGTSTESAKDTVAAFARMSYYNDSQHATPIRVDIPKSSSRMSNRSRELIQAISRSMSPIRVREEDGTEVPVTTSPSFARIIGDLEDMLNQALELAGRAVKDSSSALDQRDASIRSSRSGRSMLSAFGGTDVVTAPESIIDPDDDLNLDEPTPEKVPEQRKPKIPEAWTPKKHSPEVAEETPSHSSITHKNKRLTSPATDYVARQSTGAHVETQRASAAAMHSDVGQPPNQSTVARAEKLRASPPAKYPENSEPTSQSSVAPRNNYHTGADAIYFENGDPTSQSSVAHKANGHTSTAAVYSDSGEPTSKSSVAHVEKRHTKARASTAPLPFIDLQESVRERVWNQQWQDVSSEGLSTRAINGGSHRGFNAKSSTSGSDRFRMEMGRDGEIILVRLNQQPTLAPGLSVPGDKTGQNIPQRYKGGWEWGLWGKRFTAGVSCGVVGLIGWIVGSYIAELPRIQEHLEISPQVASLGNVLFFLGLVIPVLLLWPLPLLHGRKPYLLISLSLLLPLQLPQALSLPPYTTEPRSWEGSMQPYVICLLFFRAVSGVMLGFAYMNALATIMDLFGPDTGACCRGGVVYNNRAPVEGQNQYHAVPGGESGVRMGIWVGIFTWLLVASPALGYLFGAITIERSNPAWGFWTVMILAGFLLTLIVIAPEVRPPWKRIQMAEKPSARRMRHSLTASRVPEILERGEIKLVMYGISPQWWWEEVTAGMSLTWRMLQQTGFLLVAVYFGWVFGHIILVMILLASLITVEYGFSTINTGVAIFALFLGALLVVPTQLSVYYSTNFRHRSGLTMHNREYGHKDVGQHSYRRWLWMGTIFLPLTSIVLTISAMGPPVHFMVPVFLAAVVSFTGALVIAECYLMIMDNFDISDLPEPLLSSGSGSISQGANTTNHPHGTQRPASLAPLDDNSFTTSHPCLSSGLAIFHTLAFLFAALAVGVSTRIVEGLGVRSGLGVYSAVTCVVTFGLAFALWRRKDVRLMEVFNEEPAERTTKISLLQRSWGSRWTEVNGMEWWEDEHTV